MNTSRGLIAVCLLSAALLFLFYGQPIRHINSTFFAPGGDGLKDYYNAYYHIRYDSTYWHSTSMNYPYGEQVFFTGNQPALSNPLRWARLMGLDLSNYTLGIINGMMLLGLLLGAVFIYLLMTSLGLPSWYSVLVAPAIALLSPQLARMGGHFSLSYVCAIPAMLYFVHRFDRKPGFRTSSIIGLIVLWGFGSHIYLAGFFAAILICYWIYAFVRPEDTLSRQQKGLHLGLQLLIPIVLFFVVAWITDPVSDRSAYPWGFLQFRAYPASIFLPLGKPYGQWLYRFSDFSYIEWEGVAYLGLVATIGILTSLLIFIRKIFLQNISGAFQISHNTHLNVFFWMSVLSLFWAMGLPFILGLQDLVHFIGPLKQMRGIARFAWIFFYVANILVFYQLWYLHHTSIRRGLWILLLVGGISMLYYDAWLNAHFWSKVVRNELTELNDRANTLEENQWVHQLDAERYQAIIPLPYFHVGSENTWVVAECQIDRFAQIVSWKTGLPNMGVMLSRTSLSQTFNSVQLFQEPYRQPQILDQMNSLKPLLLVVSKDCDKLKPPQQQLVDKARYIASNSSFALYELAFADLAKLAEGLYEQVMQEKLNTPLFAHHDMWTNGETLDFVYLDVASTSSTPGYFAPGSLEQNLGSKAVFFEQPIPAIDPEKDYVVSFWISDYTQDLFLRSSLQYQLFSAQGEHYDTQGTQLFWKVSIFDGQWALIEHTLRLRAEGDVLKIRLRNRDLRRRHFKVNHIMVRPLERDIYQSGPDWVMRNNRFYRKE